MQSGRRSNSAQPVFAFCSGLGYTEVGRSRCASGLAIAWAPELLVCAAMPAHEEVDFPKLPISHNFSLFAAAKHLLDAALRTRSSRLFSPRVRAGDPRRAWMQGLKPALGNGSNPLFPPTGH
jgi:hypothetical protein